MRRLFSGNIFSISSVIVTILLSFFVWLAVSSIEQRVSAGWVGYYRIGFPFVYATTSPASTA